MKCATVISAVAFLLFAAAHLVRLVLGIHVKVGEAEVPMWVSIAGCIVSVTLAWMLLREGRGICMPAEDHCVKGKPVA